MRRKEGTGPTAIVLLRDTGDHERCPGPRGARLGSKPGRWLNLKSPRGHHDRGTIALGQGVRSMYREGPAPGGVRTVCRSAKARSAPHLGLRQGRLGGVIQAPASRRGTARSFGTGWR